MLKPHESLHWMLIPAFLSACGPVDDQITDEDITEEIAEEVTDESTLCDIDGCNTDRDFGDNGVDDGGSSWSSAVTISLGGTFTDEINSNTDADYFKFYQYAGVVTRVSVSGANCWLHYKTGWGTYPTSGYTDSNGDPGICFIQFVPTVSRYWYIKVARTDGVYGIPHTTGASKPCPTQDHSPLVEGVPLSGSGADVCCVPLVCRYDSYCCNNWWDATCVSEAHEWCGW